MNLLGPPQLYASNLVQISLEEFQDNATKIIELRNLFRNEKAENEFLLHQREQDWLVQMKVLREEQEQKIASERARFEKQQVSACRERARTCTAATRAAQVCSAPQLGA